MNVFPVIFSYENYESKVFRICQKCTQLRVNEPIGDITAHFVVVT